MKINQHVDEPYDMLFNVICVVALLQDLFTSTTAGTLDFQENGLTGLALLCESINDALTEVAMQFREDK